MNKALITALLMLTASFATYTYTVDVDRSGAASVTLSLEGGDTVNVSLPIDATNFRVVGGSYKTADGGVVVSAGSSGLATFSYSTSQFTTKTDSGWKLSFSPPEGAYVRIYAPPYSAIGNSFPQPDSVSSDGFRLIIENSPAKQVTVYYSLEEPPQAGEQSDLALPAIALLAALALAGAYLLRRKPQAAAPQPQASKAAVPPAEHAPSLEMTPGKRGMMETFNENDLSIINFLLGCGGKSRRNELERKTGISKSSLAMAINRLEKRKMLEIDRTSTTHFVRLSDYFLRL
jgi:LPXTG-motif cell wall-anchored protein